MRIPPLWPANHCLKNRGEGLAGALDGLAVSSDSANGHASGLCGEALNFSISSVSEVQVQSVSFAAKRHALPTPNRFFVLLPLSGGSSFIAASAAVARVISGWMFERSTKPGATRRAFFAPGPHAGSSAIDERIGLGHR